jgi:hypothetical protein
VAGWSLRSLFNRRNAAPNPWMSAGSSLIGWFIPREDTLTGWARDEYGIVARSMVFEVTRDGQVIASCPGTWQPEQQHEPGRFNFSLPIDGRFTRKDLVIESVTVIARDSFGNRGRLRLDGTAQLELIREHLGVRAEVILDLDFGRDGNARPYLGAGWYGPDAEATWTQDDDSFISFDAPTGPGTYALRLTAGAFVRRPDPPQQDLDVFVNTSQIASLVYRGWQFRSEECKFSHEAFASSSRTTLHFHHPGAARPSELYDSTDNRCLAIHFKHVTLVRLPEPE